jgi:hypothetical protein
VDPFADNDPAHGGVEDDNPPPNVTESASQVLYQNGKPVAVDQPTGLYAVTPSPASFRMVVDTVRKSPYFTLSTKAHTEWTFRSSHADGSGQLPAGWECDLAGLTDCAVTPLMMARYDLPQSMSDRHPAGATSFVLTVAHLQGGPELPVTSATVSVSYDDGATWQPTKVTDVGDSHFRVSYTTPAVKATNGFVALKLSAVDASGGTITQTISRAYALG